MEQQTLNPYYELGVEPGVSPQQLKQAYRQSVMRYHPDTSSGNGNAKKFRQVTEAYQLLQKMNAYQSTHAEKKTVSRASNLRQKFSSVFKKRNNRRQKLPGHGGKKYLFHRKMMKKLKLTARQYISHWKS